MSDLPEFYARLREQLAEWEMIRDPYPSNEETKQ